MAKDAGATASQARAGRSPAALRQGARLDLQPGQWVEPWLVIQAVAQWLGPPVVRQRGSCADSFVARLRALPISSSFSAVLRSVATIRWAGSESRILRDWQGVFPGERKVDPHERSGHIGDDVKY